MGPPAAGAEAMHTGTFIRQMTDMRRLAEWPETPYTVFQVSSYDRRSEFFGGPGWFANSDGFGNEPIPGVMDVLEEPGEDKVGRFLLADVKGPGVMVRGWTARMNGTLTMWLDGEKEPVFDGAANDFLRDFYGAVSRANGIEPVITGLSGVGEVGYGLTMTQRDAGYYPVPFAKGCRIEWRGKLNELHFYHIEFRQYPEGTPIQTFRAEDLKTYADDIHSAQSGLYHCKISAKAPSEQWDNKTVQVPAGETVDILPDLKVAAGQPGLVTELGMKFQADDLNRALRQAVLRVTFDGVSRPQIEAPLGDFFGAAPGVNPYNTLPFTVTGDGIMTCRFAMPFEKSARFEVRNHSDQELAIECLATIERYEWTDRSLWFHALWRVNHGIDFRTDEVFDVPYILANGQGRFVGCAAYLMNPATVPHSYGNWWGEGDEKIFVDDDTFPSFFGTGSEDYFNYSWSSPDLFTHAYFSQPRNDGPGNRGYVTNNRFHVLDDILFQDRLAFYMEMYHHRNVDGLSYARTAYFYARPGVYSDHAPFFKKELELPALPNWRPTASHGAANAIFSEMDRLPGAEGLTAEGPLYSEGRAMVWSPVKDGAALLLTLTAPKAGRYQLNLTMERTPGSGRFALRLNGESILEGEGKEWQCDLFTPDHPILRNVSPGVVDLKEGANELVLIAREANSKSKGARIGGDFIWITPR